MIIGNNGNNNIDFSNQFNNRFKLIQDEAKKNQNKMNTLQSNDVTKHYDVRNPNEMADKSLTMLQDRLNNGLISLEEFNEKAKKINRYRQ